MSFVTLSSSQPINGTIVPPPDKSISHRALIFNSLFEGEARVTNLLEAEDIFSTIRVLRALGVHIDKVSGDYIIKSPGLQPAKVPLECGNSGTTMRLMIGIMASFKALTMFTGDESLSKRPMARVYKPLEKQGVEVVSMGGTPPLAMYGAAGECVHYHLPIASAQVKSALTLYGLLNKGAVLSGCGASRDHTERMLSAMGAQLSYGSGLVEIQPGTLKSMDIEVPNDPSSAAFFAAAAILTRGSVLLKAVNINPTRTGFYRCLRLMGIDVRFQSKHIVCGEPVGDILINYQPYIGIEIDSEMVPTLIDELPLIAVLGVFAKGTTKVSGARELRHKESDRISCMVSNLKRMGAEIEEYEDGFTVMGIGELQGATLDSYGDHRIAMAMIVAALTAKDECKIRNTECISISFPSFLSDLTSLGIVYSEVTQ